jgi:arylsulfatase
MTADDAVASRPNIVLIMADDMGFSDIGPYGSEIDTPNLDRLAAQGTRFTQMYNFARCCPSRASLLTGLYPHQAGVGHMTNYVPDAPGYQGYLNESCVTVAEVLKDAGYRTNMSGKWHAGDVAGDPDLPPEMRRGFERLFGIGGGGSYYKRDQLWRDATPYVDESPDFFLTDQISDHAVDMIRESVSDAKPFFTYVAYTAPHWPLHAFEEDIARFEDRYSDGWDATRTVRHEELKGLGLLDSRWEISPRDEDVPPWPDARHQEWESLRMAVYAAQIYRMDKGIGRILDALKDTGIDDNTLVMFLSDNGGCAEFLREDGRDAPDAFLRNLTTRDGAPVRVGNSPEIRPGGDDTFMSYDVQWANVSTTPFRRYKHWVHEGGISTPFIMRWPDRISQTRIVHESAQIIDITATCIEVAGARYPSEYANRAITPLEGESLLPVIDGESWRRDKPMCWEHEGNRAIRMGHWKLVSAYGGPWELYDMDVDRTELNDLSLVNNPIVAELSGLWGSWAVRCGVLPWPPPGATDTWDFIGLKADGGWVMDTRHAHKV